MKLILLVFATLLGFTLCQTGLTGCDSFTSEKNCTTTSTVNVACVWCPALKKCRVEAAGCNCTECPPSTKPTGGLCSDNKTPRPVRCDLTTCTWRIGDDCPIVDVSLCPDGSPKLACIISPCLVRNNPDAVSCTENYCGETCTASCNNTENVEVPCNNKDAPPPVDCTDETNCAGTKPTVTCTNGAVVCAKNPSYNTTSNDSPKCAWIKYCPPTTLPTTCGDGDCKTQSLDASALNCGVGVSATTICKRVITSSTTVDGKIPTSQCVLTAVCPTPTTPPITPAPTCTVGGICGDMCVESNSAIVPSLQTLDPALCKANLTCLQKCSNNYRDVNSCKYTSGTGCSFSYSQGFGDCIKNCTRPTPPSYICAGGPCGCNYDKCFVCIKTFSTQDHSLTITSQTCQDRVSASDCLSNGASLLSKPDYCAIEQNDTIPEDAKKVVDAIVNNFNVDNLQARVDALSSTVPEAKDFLIAVKLTLTPSVQSDKTVNVQFVVEITGKADPSSTQLQGICNGVISVAAKNVTKSVISVASCKLEKVSTSSNKRALQQSGGGSYIATLQTASAASPTGPTSPTDSGASSIQFISFAVAMILALISLVI